MTPNGKVERGQKRKGQAQKAQGLARVGRGRSAAARLKAEQRQSVHPVGSDLMGLGLGVKRHGVSFTVMGAERERQQPKQAERQCEVDGRSADRSPVDMPVHVSHPALPRASCRPPTDPALSAKASKQVSRAWIRREYGRAV